MLWLHCVIYVLGVFFPLYPVGLLRHEPAPADPGGAGSGPVGGGAGLIGRVPGGTPGLVAAGGCGLTDRREEYRYASDDCCVVFCGLAGRAPPLPFICSWFPRERCSIPNVGGSLAVVGESDFLLGLGS